MSDNRSARVSRRKISNRKVVVDSSDEDVDQSHQIDEGSEGEFTPAPRRSPRRQTRRKTTDVPSTPRTTARSRNIGDAEPTEPSQIFSPAESNALEPISPSKKASPAKKRAPRVNRKSEISVAADATADAAPPLPTPQPSASPEPQTSHGTPLADITRTAVNERGYVSSLKGAGRIDIGTTVLERSLDLVDRTRSATTAAPPAPEEPSAPKSRLVITYLTLTNFKSYAGRQEVGPFHASFSSVVGPNGSGKSNVIDSLLFVFGFRASKMRQGKISALIHNSAAFPNLDYCEVEVRFQEVMDLPTGGHEAVPESALVISRRAFKNNASKYYINGKESNFTTVTTLLRDRGVDLDHKRFLILQGEVESIAQMKPKAANEHDDGLLEYLEDIIGTSKYKTPIEESAVETENLNGVCLEKSSRVQLVEKEKNGLEDKKNKALAFIRDENELTSKRSALYQIHVQNCSDKMQVTQEAMLQIQTSLDEELRKHEGSEEGIKQLQTHYKDGTKDYEKLEKQTQDVLKEASKMDKESVKFEEKKKFLTNKRNKLEKTQQTSEFAAAESETLIKQHSDDIERNTEQISELEDEVRREEEQLASIRESMKGKTEGLSREIAEKQSALEPWNEQIDQKQSAIAVARSELDILREKQNAGGVAIAEVQAKISGLDETRSIKSSELEEHKAKKMQFETEARRLQADMDALTTQEPKIRTKLSGARQKADEARASLSSAQNQGNVLSGLLRLKESGRISGFHGRLGNLGAIDQKYDISISTACPSLDNLVVDSVEVGQQCIDYLRKNNLGRANFILLDRLPQRDLSPIETPENVPRLFDLVKSKEDRFRPAFLSVLQNTLVAQDLQQANRIAYGAKRWRVVTLDGQLIDKSGTMSGGGTRVAKGGMSSKLAADVSKDQVTKLEVDRDAMEQEFQQLQQQQRILESSLREVQEQIPKLDTQAQKVALEIDSINRNVADAHKRVQELSAEQQPSKSDKSRVTTLEKNIVLMERDVERLRTETAGIEEEMKALQDRIMEIGGVKLRSQKAKVDGLREQISTLADEMSSAEINRAKAEKQKTKHHKAQVEAVAEIEKLAMQLEKVDGDIKVQVRKASEFRQQADEAQEALETKKDELQAVKSELDARTTELNETRGVEIEMRNKLEESTKLVNECKKQLGHWQEKLGKLTLQNTTDQGEEQEADALPTFTKDELVDLEKDTLKREITTLEEKTQNINVDLNVLSEYRRRVEELAARSTDLSEAVATRDAARRRCDELRSLRLEGFMEGFSTISLRLKEMYQMITMGGNAELELVDSLDPFSEGILFSVMPPKKSWKNISNLSGGEKTLSSLALVFALHHYKPTPLYVMDEIDAALDFRNVSIVASYIKERTKNAQFVVISLRNNMVSNMREMLALPLTDIQFELASRLVGVYKVNHMTKSVTVENKDYITGRA